VLIASDVRAYICRDPVNMRKAIDGLSYLVEPLLAQKPASGNLFVFVARDRSKVKILYWDRTGFALWYKRLERVMRTSCTEVSTRPAFRAMLQAFGKRPFPVTLLTRSARLHARRAQRVARRH
jgi:hypothetical protein